jgi:hypothetical protein
MNKIGLNLARMAWPIDPYGRQQTHSETCYTSHAGCAVHRLADELEKLRDAAQKVVDQAEDNSCMECYHEYKVLLSGSSVKSLSDLLPKEPQ